MEVWIVLVDTDRLFGYLMNVPGVHTTRIPYVMVCRSQTSLGGFSLSWKWVSGETPLDILAMSNMHCMIGEQYE